MTFIWLTQQRIFKVQHAVLIVRNSVTIIISCRVRFLLPLEVHKITFDGENSYRLNGKFEPGERQSKVMACSRVLLVCVIAALAVCSTQGNPANLRDPPTYSEFYVAAGVIKLPYAEIEEPFNASYDATTQKSRIDYYNGMVKTYQRGDLYASGLSWKVTPMSNEVVQNAITCFALNGSADSPVTVQSILPDLTGFTFSNNENFNNILTAKWVKVEQQGQKYNKYTFWASEADNTPVHYEMQGYDSLLGSHYDKYEIDYTSYSETQPDPAVFEIDTTLTCGDYPGPGVSSIHLHNPIKEFVDNSDNHVHHLFEEFKGVHDKKYESEHEHTMRKNVFRQNLRYIHSVNRQGLSYQLATNHLADYTEGEMRMMRGRIPSKGYNGGLPFDTTNFKVKAAPDSIDWRLYGAVTPVKDQAICGSCWSYGTAQTIEGSWFLKTGNLVRLSEQSLIDCSWGYGNNGCDGGEDYRAYQWILKHGGIPATQSYGPYLGENGYCHADNSTKLAAITGYVNVTSGDIDALKLAVANQGPISVSIDASLKSFSFYANGVYYDEACKNGDDELDHSVLAVGYGTLDGEPYWLIKNSWSTYWGNDGYVLMSQTLNNCGVATAPTYVLLAD